MTATIGTRPTAKQIAMVWACVAKKTMIGWRNIWSMKWRDFSHDGCHWKR